MRKTSTRGEISTEEIEELEKDFSHNEIASVSDTRVGMRDSPLPLSALSRLTYKFIRLPFKSTRFVQVDSADSTYALDTDGLLWMWYGRKDRFFTNLTEEEGIPTVIRQEGVLIEDKVLLIRGCAVLVQNRGIMVLQPWEWGIDCSDSEFRDIGGYTCIGGKFRCVRAITVSNTEAGIRDFAVINTHVILLKSDGTVSGYDLDGHPEFAVDVERLNTWGLFVQLTACDKRFGLVTKDGRAVVCSITVDGDRLSKVTPSFITELFSLRIAYLGLGEQYCVALSDEGEVYTWGKEYRMNGSLGLGRYNKIEGRNDIVWVSDPDGARSFAVKHPIKIKLPGKAYGIVAQKQCWVVLVDDGILRKRKLKEPTAVKRKC